MSATLRDAAQSTWSSDGLLNEGIKGRNLCRCEMVVSLASSSRTEASIFHPIISEIMSQVNDSYDCETAT